MRDRSITAATPHFLFANRGPISSPEWSDGRSRSPLPAKARPSRARARAQGHGEHHPRSWAKACKARERNFTADHAVDDRRICLLVTAEGVRPSTHVSPSRRCRTSFTTSHPSSRIEVRGKRQGKPKSTASRQFRCHYFATFTVLTTTNNIDRENQAWPAFAFSSRPTPAEEQQRDTDTRARGGLSIHYHYHFVDNNNNNNQKAKITAGLFTARAQNPPTSRCRW